MARERAVIVGAGDGLSAAVARRFAAEGASIALVARNVDKLKDLATELKAEVFGADASEPDAVMDLFAALDLKFGIPDFVLYNPSARARGPLVELEPEAVRTSLLVSAYGGFLVAQQAAKRMLAREGGASGSLFFTGASASVKGYPQSAPFAMGKFALRGLAQSLARELAPKNIHVAHFVIDGGGGYNVLDLSAFDVSEITVDQANGTVTVDLGGGESFTIDFSGVGHFMAGGVGDAPMLSTGGDIVVNESESVQINASGFSSGTGELTYTWTQVSGPAVSIDSADTGQPSFETPELDSSTTMRFRVEVSDGTTTGIEYVTVGITADNDPGIIDLGPEGGDLGGEIVAMGTPEEVAANKKSYTGQYLSRVLPIANKTAKRKKAS